MKVQFVQDDEHYVRTENPVHLVDIVHSRLYLRHHVPSNMYFVVATAGKQDYIIARSMNKRYCEHVFEDLKRTKQNIIKQLRRQNGKSQA